MMNLSVSRVCAVVQTLAMLSLAQPSFAQQTMAPTPAVSQPQVAAPSAPEAAAPANARSLKAETAGLRELSPWSMFLNADILVKAVMIGLAFASLLTWTIFI